MTNKEILEEVYTRLKAVVKADRALSVYRRSDIISFIEQEWQRADEEERTKWENAHLGISDHPLTKWDEGQMYNANEQDVNENSAGGGAHGYFSSSWYKKECEVSKKCPQIGDMGSETKSVDAKDIERHRGLEIGEDGTVKGFTDE